LGTGHASFPAVPSPVSFLHGFDLFFAMGNLKIVYWKGFLLGCLLTMLRDIGLPVFLMVILGKEDMSKMAFICPGFVGRFDWVVMTFGLKNAGATYQLGLLG
jgi:hypothetical protein